VDNHSNPAIAFSDGVSFSEVGRSGLRGGFEIASNLIADIVVLVHFSFILFVVLGGFLVLKWKWIAWLHIPCALWGILIEFFGWICPLTPLENRLRSLAFRSGYAEGFIDHYIMPIVYPQGLTRGIQLALGIGVVTINLCIYGLILFRQSGRRKEESFFDDRTR